MHLVIPVTFGSLSALVGLLPVFVATGALMWLGSHLSRLARRAA
jgi:hypothetical protein